MSITTLSVRLVAGVQLHASASGVWRLQLHDRITEFSVKHASLQRALEKLSKNDWLPFQRVEESTTVPQESFLKLQLGRLWRAGVLQQELRTGDDQYAVLQDYSGRIPFLPKSVDSREVFYTLPGGFARVEPEHIIIETPEAGAQIFSASPFILRSLDALRRGTSSDHIAKSNEAPKPAVQTLFGWLRAIMFIGSVEEVELSRNKFQNWSFADRLMHARSRLGRNIGGYGGTFHGRAISAGPFIGRSWQAITLIPLPQCTNDLVPIGDSLGSLLQRRISLRGALSEPLRLKELAAFLYHALHYNERLGADGWRTFNRPFPSAGGLYELEFYPLINHCDGIPAGFYRYDGHAHCLEMIAPESQDTKRMLVDAAQSTKSSTPPDVLIVITACFTRVNWKYESIAYSLILKDVGVALQTMYLIATALELAPCAVGGGDVECFARLTKQDIWDESPVGEIIINGRQSQPLP